jgi:hypothetical protein
MQADPDCIPYALSQVLATARLVTEDEWIHRKVLLRALGDLAEETDLDKTAPEIIFDSLTTAYKALGVRDPYENEKARTNKAMVALQDEFRKRIDEAEDRLAEALHLAVAGAAIESGVRDRVAAEYALRQALDQPLAHDDGPALLRALGRAETVLYVLNNAGEVILDRLFIEEIARTRKVSVVARHSPVLTDVTVDEARARGFEEIENVTLVDPGAPMLGLWLAKGGNDLRDRYESADVVITKGQANFESLASAEREFFHLMRARSVAVANRLEVDPGSLVVYRRRSPKTTSDSGARKRRSGG